MRDRLIELGFISAGGSCSDKLFSHAVRYRVFFNVEADFWLWRHWRGSEQRAEFLVNVTESAVVEEQGFVNFGQALEDGGVGGEVLAHFDEGAHDVQAH